MPKQTRRAGYGAAISTARRRIGRRRGRAASIDDGAFRIPSESGQPEKALIERDLIAYDGTRFQVLSLPERPRPDRPRELRTPEDFAEHDTATIRALVRRSSPRGGNGEPGDGTR